MNEDGRQQEQGADDERNGGFFDRSLPFSEGPHVSLQGKGSWVKLLMLLEVSPDALVMVDSVGHIVSVNNQAQALFGYTYSELEGKALEALLPERFRTAHLLDRERYATSPRTRPMGAGLELYGRRKDGSEFPVDISLSPLLFDGTLHVLAAIRDITARSRLEARERAARETAEAHLALLQLVLDELPTCVYFVTGSEARLVLANRAAVTLWGSEWPTGQPMLDFLSTHHIQLLDTNGQSLPPTAFATLRALQEGKRVFHHQEIIRHADGTSLPVLVNAVVLDQRLLAGLEASEKNHHLSAAEPAALVVIQDVTPLKEAEQLKDRFIGLVAHELRNPLAALKGFAQTLMRHSQGDEGTTLAPWQQETLTEIDLATNRLTRLTEDLLDVVRLQAGRLELQRESIDLVEITRHVIAQMEPYSDRHQFTLSTSLSHLQAEVDQGRIEQVLVNLLTNAIKYSPGGGKIEVTVQVPSGGRRPSSVFGTTASAFRKQSKPTSLVGLSGRPIASPMGSAGPAWASTCVVNWSRSMEETSGSSRPRELVRRSSSVFPSHQASPRPTAPLPCDTHSQTNGAQSWLSSCSMGRERCCLSERALGRDQHLL